MNIFIDTNVFLSFYHLTNDDLEELRKLFVLLEKDEIALFLPSQVVDEFWRNRENKIAAAIKSLKEQKLNLQFPQLCKDYEEYPKLREYQKEYEKQHSILLKKITDDVESNTLKADEIIEELFDKATFIESSDEIISKARLRMDVGNPPGKDGSLGDAINWESLLTDVPKNEDLYFIADDKDYFSVLDENKPKEFLAYEWVEEKNSDIHFYRRLAPFFKEHYPDIKLASDIEKEINIRKFVTSRAFVTTHSAVEKLNKYEDFSVPQVSEIVNAALSNNQINWIIGDTDVHEFLTKILTIYKDNIEEDKLVLLSEELNKYIEDEETSSEIPF